MGRASKWLRSLLGAKTPDSNEPRFPKDKQRNWSFIRSFKEKRQLPAPPPPPSSHREPSSKPVIVVVDEEEQNKRAIAVAAATAAVAEAAVAAAHAAAAVVRLTSSGRSTAGFGSAAAVLSAKRGELAAVKIQSAFRGYLARRALKALRGLVKLQALVRGSIVRKQATETLRCMHALVRVQERAQACRAIQTERSKSDREPRSHAGPPTPEKHEKTAKGTVKKTDRSGSLKKNSTKLAGGDPAAGWNWLDKSTEEHYGDTRAANRKAGAATKLTDNEKNAKILEVDPGKPHCNPKTKNNHYRSSCSTITSDQNTRSFGTILESPSKDSTIAQLSATSPSSVDMQQCLSPLRFAAESVDFVESPRSLSRPESSRGGPFTPSKSECSRSLFSGYSDYPSYMANTESSLAKVRRSHSAPKQRPEFEKSGSLKRASAHGLTQYSGALYYKSSSLHANFANKAYPGSGRLDRLGMPIRM